MMYSSRAKCYLWYSHLCNQNIPFLISRGLWTFYVIYKMILIAGNIKMNITYVVCFHYTTRCVWYAWKFLTNFFVKFTFSNRSVISENMVAASIQFQTQAHTMPPCRSQCFPWFDATPHLSVCITFPTMHINKYVYLILS